MIIGNVSVHRTFRTALLNDISRESWDIGYVGLGHVAVVHGFGVDPDGIVTRLYGPSAWPKDLDDRDCRNAVKAAREAGE